MKRYMVAALLVAVVVALAGCGLHFKPEIPDGYYSGVVLKTDGGAGGLRGPVVIIAIDRGPRVIITGEAEKLAADSSVGARIRFTKKGNRLDGYEFINE